MVVKNIFANGGTFPLEVQMSYNNHLMNHIPNIVVATILVCVFLIPVVYTLSEGLESTEYATNSGIRYRIMDDTESTTMTITNTAIEVNGVSIPKNIGSYYPVVVGDTFIMTLSDEKISLRAAGYSTSYYTTGAVMSFDEGHLKITTSGGTVHNRGTYTAVMIPDASGDLARHKVSVADKISDTSVMYGILSNAVSGATAYGFFAYDFYGTCVASYATVSVGESFEKFTDLDKITVLIRDLDQDGPLYSYTLSPIVSGEVSEQLNYCWSPYSVEYSVPNTNSTLISLIPVLVIVGLMWGMINQFMRKDDDRT